MALVEAGERIAVYLAVMKFGHVAVPFSDKLTPDNVRRNASLVGCTVVFAVGALCADTRPSSVTGSPFGLRRSTCRRSPPGKQRTRLRLLSEAYRSLPWAPTVLHRNSSYYDDPFDAHITTSSVDEPKTRE
jgi:hypothetical protein